MVVLGVAVAVAVLAGALLVGASVRESLREIALGRLGATDVVVSSPTFFRAALADDCRRSTGSRRDSGAADRRRRRRRRTTNRSASAGRVMVYGIDERFGRFHGVDGFAVSGREALISPALAAELGAKAGDTITLRVAKPTDIPLSTLQGRRETTGERIRLTVARVLDRSPLGEFSLAPSQGPVLALYVPMARLQRDLDLGDASTRCWCKAASATPAIDPARRSIAPAATLDDLGLRVRADAGGRHHRREPRRAA